MSNKPDAEQQTATQVNEEQYRRSIAMRVAFEAWLKTAHPSRGDHSVTAVTRDDEVPDDYLMRFTSYGWETWQAAIASVRAEDNPFDMLQAALADKMRELAEIKAQRDLLMKIGSERLGTDFEKILHDNAWDLYEH